MINKFFKRKPKLVIKLENETEQNFDLKIWKLVNEYIPKEKKKKLKGKKLNIIVPKNYKEKLYNLSTAEHKEHFNDFGTPELNGCLVLPIDKKSTEFTILLNKRIFDSDQYFSTIPHEITHVFDFNDYFTQYGNIFILDRESKKENFYFVHYLWTEFNAKKIGIQRFKKELDKTKSNINLEVSTKNFKEDVDNNLFYLTKSYHLMHHFGRMSVYDNGLLSFNNNYFPESYLKQIFGENVMTLYHTLKEITNYSEFDKEKEFLKYLMKQ